MAFIYAPLQQRTLPTMDEALKAYRKAVAADLSSRDVRPLLAIEEQLAQVDPRLAGHINARSAALAGFPWRIKSRVDGGEEAALAVDTRLRQAIDDLIERQLDSYLYGHSLAELSWALDTTGWVPDATKFYDASDLEPHADTAMYPGGVAVLEATQTGFLRKPALPTTLNGQAVTYIIGRRGNTIGGAMRPIMFYQILLHMNLQQWTEFNRRIKGLAVSKYRTGASDDDVATAKAAGEQIGASNAVAISDSVLFEFVKMVDAIGKDSYEQYMERLDARVEMALRGQANTAELPKGGGSRAALQVSHLVEVDNLFWDIKATLKVMNRQLLRQDYEKNVNSVVPMRLPYEFEFITDEIEDNEKNARVLETIVRSGYMPDIEEVRRKTGWETLEPAGTDPNAI